MSSAATPSTETARLLHSKAVDHFWEKIEPFCAEIEPKTVKVLENFINSYNKDEKKTNVKSNGSESASSVVSSPKSKKQISADLGPLTRRLVSALLEDNFAIDSAASSDDQFSSSTAAGNNNYISPPSSMALARSLDLGSTVALEKRVKRLLERHDIFDSSDSNSNSSSDSEEVTPSPTKKGKKQDEVTMEIERCQQDLKKLSESNMVQLKSLVTIANSASQAAPLRAQLSKLEDDIEESYQRAMTAKQRKKLPNVVKKERENFHRLLIEWRKTVNRLENLI